MGRLLLECFATIDDSARERDASRILLGDQGTSSLFVQYAVRWRSTGMASRTPESCEEYPCEIAPRRMRAIYIAVVEVGCFAFLGSVSEIQMKLDALLSILLVITGLGVPCS